MVRSIIQQYNSLLSPVFILSLQLVAKFQKEPPNLLTVVSSKVHCVVEVSLTANSCYNTYLGQPLRIHCIRWMIDQGPAFVPEISLINDTLIYIYNSLSTVHLLNEHWLVNMKTVGNLSLKDVSLSSTSIDSTLSKISPSTTILISVTCGCCGMRRMLIWSMCLRLLNLLCLHLLLVTWAKEKYPLPLESIKRRTWREQLMIYDVDCRVVWMHSYLTVSE